MFSSLLFIALTDKLIYYQIFRKYQIPTHNYQLDANVNGVYLFEA